LFFQICFAIDLINLLVSSNDMHVRYNTVFKEKHAIKWYINLCVNNMKNHLNLF